MGNSANFYPTISLKMQNIGGNILFWGKASHNLLGINNPLESHSKTLSIGDMKEQEIDGNIDDSESSIDSINNLQDNNLKSLIQQIFGKYTDKNDIIINNDSSIIGGENVMDHGQNNYVTHRELDEKINRISDKIDSSEKYLKEHIERKSAETNEKIAETNGKIDVLTQSINDFKQSFPQTVNLAVRDEFDKRDKERKETNRFIIGTLVIGGISLIVSIASVIVSIFIH
jgi:hypothetical protein